MNVNDRKLRKDQKRSNDLAEQDQTADGKRPSDCAEASPEVLPLTESVETLFQKHTAELQKFATGLLGDSNLAADAIQATFAKLIESHASLKPVALRAWLFKVAYNKAMEIRRRQTVEKRALQRLAVDAVSEDSKKETLDFDSIAKIKREVARLSAAQQLVVQKRIYEDKKFAEIAEELNIPLGTVLTRMRSALKILAKRIEP